MKKNKIIGACFASLAILGLASCGGKKDDSEHTTYYCSASASNVDALGTMEDPLPFHNAVNMVKPGDTILLLDGVYKYRSRIRIGLESDNDTIAKINGAPYYPITVKPATEGTNVTFDFSEMEFNSNNRGIQVYGNYWNFYNIDVCGAGDNGMYIAGSHNVVEGCNFYNNRDTGLQIGRGFNSQVTIEDWPSYNLIKNCTSFANYDEPTFGENADGFAAKLTVGYGNVFDGCVAFRNSDDGWDLFAKTDSGCIGTVILYNCVAFENGFLPYKIDRVGIKDNEEYTYRSYDTMNGDGIGFKLGGSVMEGDVIVNNCLSFNNKLHGFGDNSNPGVLSLKNCTAFNNCIGVDEETGHVAAVRGLEGKVDKSNNFDLARDTKSYNNYYGLVSYVNNQKDYKPLGDSEYNIDQFRGSMAYSVLNTGYKNGELYTKFGSYVDASSYHSEMVDIPFSNGESYTGISDASFADLTAINAVCNDVNDVQSLIKYHTEFRNQDGSVNMGDKIKIVDNNLLTMASGKAIGHNLSKTSNSEYEHYNLDVEASVKNRNDVLVSSVYNVLETLCDNDAVYQNFEVPYRIHGCEIKWTSKNTDVVKFMVGEKLSPSKSVVGEAKVICPNEDTLVEVEAEISSGESKLTKTFNLNVKRRNQSIGEIVNTGSSAIRVNIYGTYSQPILYVRDSSANTSDAALDPSLYELSYSYLYASDRKAKHYAVDGVYTSVPGVYEVTVKAKSKIVFDEEKTVELKYNVYVVDPDCSIDKMGTPEIKLTKDGYSISTDLTNIDGYLYSLYSKTELTGLSAKSLIENPDAKRTEIVTDSIVAEFPADNNSGENYYAYYTFVNKNASNVNDASVYKFSTKVIDVTTQDELYQICQKGTIAGVETTSTTIYNLKNDLDFAEYEWQILEKAQLKTFEGLFNGNNHTIKNLTIEGASADKNVNMFYKVNGTVMNLKFEDININNKDIDSGKQVGIIGELQGGYVHNIKMNNVSASGREAVAALIGQVSGKVNYVSNCQLINNDEQTIKVVNKYAAGIIGNVQMNSDQKDLSLFVTDCGVYANVGDGKDMGGNIGGIIGRIKNDNKKYFTSVTNCFYKGTLISKGQYTGGIIGDFESGMGPAIISNNISFADFIYDGKILKAGVTQDGDQTYAHKNSNPIVGRAVSSELSDYQSSGNLGTWTEYYYQIIISYSIYYDLADESSAYDITSSDLEERGFDIVNIWEFNESNQTLKLR